MFRRNNSLSFAQRGQSGKGYLSIGLAVIALVICLVAVIISYKNHGNAGNIVGACGIMAFLSALMGSIFGIGAIVQAESARLISWIGTVLSVVMLAGLVFMFVSGW